VPSPLPRLLLARTCGVGPHIGLAAQAAGNFQMPGKPGFSAQSTGTRCGHHSQGWVPIRCPPRSQVQVLGPVPRHGPRFSFLQKDFESRWVCVGSGLQLGVRTAPPDGRTEPGSRTIPQTTFSMPNSQKAGSTYSTPVGHAFHRCGAQGNLVGKWCSTMQSVTSPWRRSANHRSPAPPYRRRGGRRGAATEHQFQGRGRFLKSHRGPCHRPG